jgi:hypothetical protein
MSNRPSDPRLTLKTAPSRSKATPSAPVEPRAIQRQTSPPAPTIDSDRSVWIEYWAYMLEHGGYTKGEYMLRVNGCHCANGVLCDIHSIVTGNAWDDYMGYSTYLESPAVPPHEVSSIIGLPVITMVAFKNDSGSSFKEIADYLYEQIH